MPPVPSRVDRIGIETEENITLYKKSMIVKLLPKPSDSKHWLLNIFEKLIFYLLTVSSPISKSSQKVSQKIARGNYDLSGKKKNWSICRDKLNV